MVSKNLYIKTYGCQMNVYDSLLMKDLMIPYGYNLIEEMDETGADLIIINTCHIREKAAEKLYSELGRINKTKEKRAIIGQKTVIVVAGCVAQAEGDEIFTRAPFVDIVVGPQSFHTLPDLVSKINRDHKHLVELDFIEEEKFDKLPGISSAQGVSAFVSIQEGCDKFCTYCVVPYTRGNEFSRPLESIYKEVLTATRNGAKEIILLGQNVNAYHGIDNASKEVSMADLISYISEIEGVERIRYMTSHPKEMSKDLIKLHGTNEKLMPFLHLPAQSGSNKILKLMNRKYSKEEYLDIIFALKESRPDIVLSSDFIVGFPNETDQDFEDTMDLVRKVVYGQCFSFKYSPRPGTPAAVMSQISENIKDLRLAILQKELFSHQTTVNKNVIGKTIPVLYEREGKYNGHVTGRSPYWQPVYVIGKKDSLIGKTINTYIESTDGFSLSGKIEQNLKAA